MSRIIRRSKNSDNTPSDSHISDNRKVEFIKYHNVVANSVHNIVDNEGVDLSFLRGENRKLKSRIARLELEIKDQIRILESVLNADTLTFGELKRKLSRLRGSLEYPGHE